MTSRNLVALLFLVLPASGLAASPATRAYEDLVIVVGKSTTVSVPFALGSIANSSPDVAQAVPDVNTRRVIFFARKPGRATFTIFDEKKTRAVEYEIDVVKEDLVRLRDWIARELADISSVRVIVSGEDVIVEGTVVLESEMQKVEKAVLKNGEPRSNVLNTVRFTRPIKDAPVVVPGTAPL
jgi:Flp pilus assembly secretin CpaC